MKTFLIALFSASIVCLNVQAFPFKAPAKGPFTAPAFQQAFKQAF